MFLFFFLLLFMDGTTSFIAFSRNPLIMINPFNQVSSSEQSSYIGKSSIAEVPFQGRLLGLYILDYYNMTIALNMQYDLYIYTSKLYLNFSSSYRCLEQKSKGITQHFLKTFQQRVSFSLGFCCGSSKTYDCCMLQLLLRIRLQRCCSMYW